MSETFAIADYSFSFDTTDFLGAASQHGFDWSLAFTAHAGDDLLVTSVLSAHVNPCGISDSSGTTCLYGFDATHSSTLNSIQLENGYTLTSASGQLVANGDGFTYRASLAEHSGQVPEPGTIALLGAALPLLIRARARRAIGS